MLFKEITKEFEERFIKIEELSLFKKVDSSMEANEMFERAVVGMGIIILDKYIGGILSYHFWKSVVKDKRSKKYFMKTASSIYKKKPEWSTESFSLKNIWGACTKFIKANTEITNEVSAVINVVNDFIEKISKNRSIVAHQDFLSSESASTKTLFSVKEFKREFDLKYMELLNIVLG